MPQTCKKGAKKYSFLTQAYSKSRSRDQASPAPLINVRLERRSERGLPVMASGSNPRPNLFNKFAGALK